ncbi:cystatin-8 [Sapajus apella]|uniref:Cystatin-8 n=1 Tax=Sapajus apella TaxID=9515 RepID=A0A6J3FF06_SAPAP|nr:cystatin-8 [Sapajus apella]
MPRCRWLSLLLLTIPLALVSRKDPNKDEKGVLRKLQPTNASDANVRQCLWFAMQEYNRESEDKYVFLVVRTLQAQLQVTNRLEYLIDVEIARSDCRKPLSSNEICAVQENSKLKKKLSCSFLVGALPWNGEFTVMEKKCEDA